LSSGKQIQGDKGIDNRACYLSTLEAR
jgi:hypothetical protein